MRNHEALKDAITERDAEALSYLDDVRVGKLGGGDEGFFLTFHFSQNPFFSNKVRLRQYRRARSQASHAGAGRRLHCQERTADCLTFIRLPFPRQDPAEDVRHG